MKDIVLFLDNELNQTIDEISELKSLIQKTQIDIDTLMRYKLDIKSGKDYTADFFVSESDDDVFDNKEINDLNSKAEDLNKKLYDYEFNLVKENERLADIRELLNEYSEDEKDTRIDYSVNNDSNINKLIKCADSLYEDVCNFVSDKLQYQVNSLIEKNKLITSLVNSDPQRSLIELEGATDILNAISDSLNKFSEKLIRYNASYSFEQNFCFICKKYNRDKNYFTYSFADEVDLAQNFDVSKSTVYFKMLVNMYEYLNNVSRETYNVDFINYKTKTKIKFTLDLSMAFIQDEILNNDSELKILNFYLNIMNSDVKFKQTRKKFIIEIDTSLY